MIVDVIVRFFEVLLYPLAMIVDFLSSPLVGAL